MKKKGKSENGFSSRLIQAVSQNVKVLHFKPSLLSKMKTFFWKRRLVKDS